MQYHTGTCRLHVLMLHLPFGSYATNLLVLVFQSRDMPGKNIAYYGHIRYCSPGAKRT